MFNEDILIKRVIEEKKIIYARITNWQQFSQINYSEINFFFLIFNEQHFMHFKSNPGNIFFSDKSKLYFFNKINKEKTLIPYFNELSTNNEFLNDFLYLRRSSHIDFFINNMVDVPICFKKSKSLQNKNFELPLLKFSNFLMKQGKKEKAIRTLFNALRTLIQDLKTNKIDLNLNPDISAWLSFYSISNEYLYNQKDWNNVLFSFHVDTETETSFLSKIDALEQENKEKTTDAVKSKINDEKKKEEEKKIDISLTFSHNLIDSGKFLNLDFFIKIFLLKKLFKMLPIFSYFIYSVDKNIRKFSRGKSGKYTFVWKFVAPYKRKFLAMRWVTKDIKFYQNKRFQDRLLQTIKNLALTPEKTFAWRSKVFSHNYTFKNFKKTLMTSLKTAS